MNNFYLFIFCRENGKQIHGKENPGRPGSNPSWIQDLFSWISHSLSNKNYHIIALHCAGSAVSAHESLYPHTHKRPTLRGEPDDR